MLYENMGKGWQLADVWCILMGSELSDAKGVEAMRTCTTNAAHITAVEIANLAMTLESMCKDNPGLSDTENYRFARNMLNDLAKRLPKPRPVIDANA